MDIPPTILSLGLKVFFATSSPLGTNIVIVTPSSSGSTLLTSCSIISLGTGLIAASPFSI